MQKTVKVRILVVVDSDGNWGALGYRGGEWRDFISVADSLNGGPETQAWITAEVPLPDIDAIQINGTVEDASTVDPNTQ